jgi:hypothetical protein
MNPPQSYSLSIEELAYAMGILGGAEAAGAFLAMANRQGPGEVGLQPDQVRARLMAASHSLIARQLLCVDVKCSTTTLEPAFEGTVKALLQNRYSLVCSASGPQGDLAVTYFFTQNEGAQPGAVIVAWSELEVVSHLDRLDGPDAVASHLCAVFDLPGISHTFSWETPAPDGKISVQALETARLKLARHPGEAVQTLEDGGLSPLLAGQLTNDLLACVLRGSLFVTGRPQTDGTPPPERAAGGASEGLLFLKGQQHLWLFDLQPSAQPTAPLEADVYRTDLLPGSPSIFPILLRRLTHRV